MTETTIIIYKFLSSITEDKKEKELFCFITEQLKEGKIPLPSQ